MIAVEPAYCGGCMGRWKCKTIFRSVIVGSSLFLTFCTFIAQNN